MSAIEAPVVIASTAPTFSSERASSAHSAAPPARPASAPIARSRIDSTSTRRTTAPGSRSKREPHREFPRAIDHAAIRHARDADGGEHEAEHRDDAEHHRAKALRRGRFAARTRRAAARGATAATRRSAAALPCTAGTSDAGSTAVRITNATGTPELLFCAHGRYSVGSGGCVTLTSDTSSTTPTMVSGGGLARCEEDLADRVGARQQRVGKTPADDRDLRDDRRCRRR